MSGYQLGLDPAFLAAYQAPNYYQMQNVAPRDNTYVASTNPEAATNVTFTGNQNTPANNTTKSSSSTASLIVGAVLTLGAAALCRKAYIKGNPTKGFFGRIGDGFKNFWNSGTKAFSRLSKPERFSQATVDGKQVFTVPNRRNIMRTGVAESRLAEIGVSSTAPIPSTSGALNKGIKIRSGEGTLGEGAEQIIYKFKNGKLTSVKYKGENIMNPTDPTKLSIKKQVEEKVKQHLKGQDLEQLTNLTYSHSENGTSRLFRCAQGTKNPELKAAVSRYFNVNSDAVQAYAAENPKVKEALKSLAEGKTDGLKVASAEYFDPAFGTFRIENGKIKGLVQGRTFYDTTTDRFKNLYANNKELFDNVLKQEERKLTNIVRILA